jgi:anti-sigma regulatory factor (Ser/Thr protein kinase)
MRFSEEKKKTILIYLLEKIKQGEKAVSKSVSEACGVNQNTVHSYINELVENNVIQREGRGKYQLISQVYECNLKRSNGDLDNDTEAFFDCLHNHILSLKKNIQEIWAYTFTEMINNVMDHSLAENVSIKVIQDYLSTKVVIWDDGVGVFNKIRDFFGFATVDEAVCELFKGKLTTDSQNHSGEGIFFTSKMMDEFYILSSERIFSNNRYDDSKLFELSTDGSKGTCVVMSLSNFTHKEPAEVFDLYSNVDGGFIKTVIPLKNIFDSSPVSRSQAKRVCYRLEKFKEVILDFEGLEWMGQGFAHQIFVVFQRENPEITFFPINMNESVKKMYQHVRNES